VQLGKECNLGRSAKEILQTNLTSSEQFLKSKKTWYYFCNRIEEISIFEYVLVRKYK